jgi:hypothetical protein
MLTTVVLIFILLAALALIWWGIQRLGIPEPIKTVVLVVLGLVVLVVIYNFVASGGVHLTFDGHR